MDARKKYLLPKEVGQPEIKRKRGERLKNKKKVLNGSMKYS